MSLPTCAKTPCASCPYRRDVPSGVWSKEEYLKLFVYDGDMIGQLHAGARMLFMSHQQNGKLCAGWIGVNGPENLLALRLHAVDPSVWNYKSPVRLFLSNAAAAQHGMREIRRPGKKAHEMMAKITRVHQKKGGT